MVTEPQLLFNKPLALAPALKLQFFLRYGSTSASLSLPSCNKLKKFDAEVHLVKVNC